MEYRDDDRDYMRLPKNEQKETTFLRVPKMSAREKLEAVEEEIAQHEAELNQLHLTKMQLESEVKKQELLDIEKDVPYYEKKLERLKAFMPKYANIMIFFKKADHPYSDDWNQPMRDPLNWTVYEHDALGLENNVDITFEYHTEAVKTFVEKWWRDNAPSRLGLY